MNRILMLEADAWLVSAVARALARHDLTVIARDSIEPALELLKLHPFRLVILDSNLISERELGAFQGVPIVITASFLAAEPARRLAHHARLLTKPFTSAELSQVLAEETGLALGRRSLVDVLSHAHAARTSCGLRVGEGEIVLEDGELVHAAYAEMRGEAALIEILADSAAFVQSPARGGARTINRPFRPLLLEALHRLEQLERSHAKRSAG